MNYAVSIRVPTDPSASDEEKALADATLLKLEMTKDGSILLYPRHGTLTTHKGDVLRRKHRHVTVHPSEKDPDFITINQHFSFEDGESEKIVAKSEAVKKGGFTLVLADMPGILLSSDFLKKHPKFNPISLGEFDWRKGPLFYAVYVGHPEQEFLDAPCSDNDIAKIEFIIGDFKFIVLWRQLNLVHCNLGIYYISETRDARLVSEDDQTQMTALMAAKSAKKCVDHFLYQSEEATFQVARKILERCDPNEMIIAKDGFGPEQLHQQMDAARLRAELFASGDIGQEMFRPRMDGNVLRMGPVSFVFGPSPPDDA